MSKGKGEEIFSLVEEDIESVKNLSEKCSAITLCLVAPFAPLRVAPKRIVSAAFSFPDEFILEEFVTKISEVYPEKTKRPPLYLLIHSPGGTVSSSYIVARVLRNNFDKIIGFIPHIAASGATIVALACNEIVMGDISRLTGIDPHYDTDDETVYPLSIVRAFNHLEDLLKAKTVEEISFPLQHLVQSITVEKYDQAAHALQMVEEYATELMGKAGYSKDEIIEVIRGVLYEINTHEEVITLEKAKNFKIKAKHFSESSEYTACWKVMKEWLKKYYLKPSPIHIITYCLPKDLKRSKT